MALLSPIWKVGITEASDIALNLFGNENLKIEGNHILEFIPRKSRRTFVKILSTMLNEVMVHNLEIKLNRIDKTEFYWRNKRFTDKSNRWQNKSLYCRY